MSGLPPVDLASAFGSTRSAGLTGLLPTKTPPPSENAEESSSTQTAETTADAPRAPKKTSKQPAATPPPAKPKVGRPRAVIVYVTPQQQRWLRERVAPGRTLTDITLDTLEAHLEELTPTSTPDEPTGLFARSTRPAPQPGVQVQLRMTPSNSDVLDRLVAERGFPSRSALIRAALAAAAQEKR